MFKNYSIELKDHKPARRMDFLLDTLLCENFEASVREACADFIGTEEGREILEEHGGNFTWVEFWDHVPDEICTKYGIRKISVQCSADLIENGPLIGNQPAVPYEDWKAVKDYLGIHEKELLLFLRMSAVLFDRDKALRDEAYRDKKLEDVRRSMPLSLIKAWAEYVKQNA